MYGLAQLLACSWAGPYYITSTSVSYVDSALPGEKVTLLDEDVTSPQVIGALHLHCLGDVPPLPLTWSIQAMLCY